MLGDLATCLERYPSTDATWEELLAFRVQRMAMLLREDKYLDFLIEKDK